MNEICRPSELNLRLGTFNVCRMSDGIQNKNSTYKERKKSPQSMEAVAQILAESDCDVVSLQEIENADMLVALRERGNLKELFPYSILLEGNDKRKGFDVALMSRYPIKNFATFRDRIVGEVKGKPEKFSRDLLQADLRLPKDKTLRVFCNHFVAQGNKWCDEKRLREAEETANIVSKSEAQDPADYVAVLGDFNDVDSSPVLKAVQDNTDLVNSSKDLPPSWGIAKPHKKYPPKRLDHVLAGSSLMEGLVASGVFVHAKDAIASDHRLVWSEFRLSA